MKRKLSVFTILLLIFSILGCKNHALIDDALLHKNNDEHVITLQLNESSNARAITIPGIDSSDVKYYKIIITRDGNAKTYDFKKSDTYNISVKNGINTFEIAGYTERTETESGYQYSTPLLYSNNSITIDSETDSISLTVSPIIKTYTQGELAGVADKGTVSFTVRMPSQAENSGKLKSISINGLPETIAYPFKDEDKSNPIVHTTSTKVAPGVYNCSIIVQTIDNQNFLYSQTVYCAMNLITPVLLDFRNETFSTESCGEIGYINFYVSNNSGTNLISFDEDTQNYTCYGIDPTKTYYLELTMKVAGQKIDVSIKKDGDTDFGSPLVINNLSGYEISFVDEKPTVNNNYIQKLKYPFGSNQPYWMDATGGSEVKISVSKGGASKEYIIKLSPEVPVVSEDIEVSHPVDVSGMTALPVPVTELTETNYVITTEAQLFALSNFVNGKGETTGKTFVLGKDIKLTRDWTPIGNTSKTFEGIFDGNNYKVAGININGDFSDASFIGCLKDAVVKNVTVEGTIKVTDHNYRTGGVASTSYGDTRITNCINQINVEGYNHVGGILSKVESGNVVIENCSNFGNVKVNNGHGAGIIGYINLGDISVDINNCANYGNINGENPLAGIAFSYSNGSVNINNCINNGTISSTYGNLYSSLVVNSGSGTFSIINSAYLSGSAGTKTSLGSDPDPDTVTSYSHTTGKMGCTLTTAIGSTTDVKEMLNTAADNDTAYNRWIYTTNETYYGLPMFADTIARISVVPEADGVIGLNGGNALSSYEIKGALTELPDSGVISNAELKGIYSISTAEELRQLSQLAQDNTFSGYTFVLLDNILLNNELFTPIGSSSKKFAGTFDGNGNAVKGLNVVAGTNYSGLFGCCGRASIINLTVEGVIEGSGSCGGITGQIATAGIIDSCISNVKITCASGNNVGGICGDNMGTIYNCINLNNIEVNRSSGSDGISCGGISGTSSGNVYNCANFGNIKAYTYSAGIVGSLSSGNMISNCYNTGVIDCIYETGQKGAIEGYGRTGLDFSDVYMISDALPAVSGSNYPDVGEVISDPTDLRNKLNTYVEDDAYLNQWSYTYNGFPVCVDCSKVNNP